MTINQLKAIQALATCKLCKIDAVEAGIDACRSSTYRTMLAAFRVERNNCLDYSKRKAMRPPKAEPVQGATELRAWLADEYDRIMLLLKESSKTSLTLQINGLIILANHGFVL